MANRKKRKNNFLYSKGHLKVSNLIGLILIGCFCFAIVFKVHTEIINNFKEDFPLESTTAKQHKKFIKTVAPYAQQMHRQYGILPSITIAQAILESNWGQSTLSKQYHNYFGIKGNKQVPSKYFRTQEFVNGKWVTISARFRVYHSWQESVLDHSLLLVNGTQWNSKQYQSVLDAKDYKEAAQALYEDQYATDPDYPNKLINLIEKYNLNQYDN